jgi:co-chaperonin GroES (HSP10)
MIKTPKSKIVGMELMQNKLIVKILRKPEELILNDEIKLFIDFSFAHEQHAPTRGEVVNVCEGLDSKKMNWITENEVKVGDIAVYSFESAMHCWFDDPSRTLVDEEKNIYFILDYEDLFCVKRKQELIPVNGYMLCAPINDYVKSRIVLPEFVKKRNSDKFGVVKYIGKQNQGYQLLTADGPKRRPELHDSENIKLGDIVIFDKYCDLPIEHEMHSQIIGKGQILFRIHQCYIKAVIQKEFTLNFGVML